MIPRFSSNPNSSICGRPVIIYHEVFSRTNTDEIAKYLEKVGVVNVEWIATLWPMSHFHTTCHEFIVVIRGKAKICFGHIQNPSRYEPVLSAGDAVIVPAGVSHRKLDQYTRDLEMIGAAPHNTSVDWCYGRKDEEPRWNAISQLKWYEKDPIYGKKGPALEC